MTVYDAIQARRSIRRYKPDAVPEDLLARVLDAARLAPSGCAREARKLIVVRDADTRQRVSKACRGVSPGPEGKLFEGNPAVAKAPVVIVACSLVRDANMRYFGPEGEAPILFTNMSRTAGGPGYWPEYVQHAQAHHGEYESTGITDLALALDHLSLAAVAEGLGTCWIGAGIDEPALRHILAIPEDVQARMIMLLGYPEESPAPRPRKPVEEVVSYERYS
jgi:nitroreductase